MAPPGLPGPSVLRNRQIEWPKSERKQKSSLSTTAPLLGAQAATSQPPSPPPFAPTFFLRPRPCLLPLRLPLDTIINALPSTATLPQSLLPAAHGGVNVTHSVNAENQQSYRRRI